MADDVFVTNQATGEVVQFSRQNIAQNGKNATGTVLQNPLAPTGPEGIAMDADGTVVASVRHLDDPGDKVVRLSRDGVQQGTINLDLNNDGPSFDRSRKLFLNDNTTNPQVALRTLRAAAGVPPLGQTLGAGAFQTWVDTASHAAQGNTFLEDTKIAPWTLAHPQSGQEPYLGGQLFVQSASAAVGDATRVQAWSSMMANMFLKTVIADLATAFNQGPAPDLPVGQGGFESLGMAFDSQGDLWVARSFGPVGYELLEFELDAATNTFVGKRSLPLQRPGGLPVDGYPTALVKLSIAAGKPGDPTDHGGDTIFVADPGLDPFGALNSTGYLHVVDEVSGNQVYSLTSQLGGPLRHDSRLPTGVAACDWLAVTILSTSPTDGWIDPLSESDSGSPPQDTERIKKFTINFSSLVFNQDGTALSPAAFTVTTTDNPDPDIPAPPTLSIANVDATNNPTVVVTLDQPIPFGEWTTLAINVENACGVEAPTFYIDVGHLPDDTNQDGQVNTNDATLFGSLFNGAKPLELVDVDRNGQVNINDATMFGQLWNGTSGFLEWLGKGLPAEPTH